MDLVNLSIPQAMAIALQGYLVVFIGLVLLMVVIIVESAVAVSQNKKSAAKAAASKPAETTAAPAEKKLAPGSAGELKLYDTDPKVAAMCMAIVADKLGKPLNELRFISIKEVK